MIFEDKNYSVLVVSAAEKLNISFKELFSETGITSVSFESSISSAKRKTLDIPYDFVIINSPLPDDIGTRFAIDLSSNKNTIVLLLVKNEQYSSFYSKVAPHGVFLLSKPISKTAMLQSLDWMITTRERLRKVQKKAMTLEEKIPEIRVVNKAKALLIDNLKMTEDEAHHYIERMAMNKSLSRKEIAETIIKTYE